MDAGSSGSLFCIWSYCFWQAEVPDLILQKPG
jgi:hypothetical protein